MSNDQLALCVSICKSDTAQGEYLFKVVDASVTVYRTVVLYGIKHEVRTDSRTSSRRALYALPLLYTADLPVYRCEARRARQRSPGGEVGRRCISAML